MTDELISWLHQQLDALKFRADSLRLMARALHPDTGAYLIETAGLLLDDVEAKRSMLRRHSHPYCDWCADGGHEGEDGGPCPELDALATAFTSRPGYQERRRLT